MIISDGAKIKPAQGRTVVVRSGRTVLLWLTKPGESTVLYGAKVHKTPEEAAAAVSAEEAWAADLVAQYKAKGLPVPPQFAAGYWKREVVL